jgi:hypothetical protein
MHTKDEKDFRLIRRKSGGWLALTAATDSLKIGVCAPTMGEAKTRLSACAADWQRLLAGGFEQQILAAS